MRIGALAPLSVLVATSLAAGPARAADPRPRGRLTIAVMDLRARGTEEAVAATLSAEVTQSLAKLGVFTVVSGEDVRRLLSLEEARAACTGEVDAGCMAELGGALGVELLVYGDVSRLGERYVVSLSLLDAAKASALGRERAEVGSASDLLATTSRLARALVQPLLRDRRGSLVIDLREAGARVEVDGRALGISPVARQELTMGPHELRIEKEGFLTLLRTVEIQADEVRVEPVTLIPNGDFVRSYEARARTTRTWAYVTAGAAVALLGAAGTIRLVNDARFDGLVSRQELELKTRCDDGSAATGGTYCPTASGRAAGVVDTVRSIETLDTIALVAASAGLASALSSVLLFVFGEEPGRYAPFETSLEVSPSGARLQLAF